MRRSLLTTLLIVAVLAATAITYVLKGPYLFPTTIAIGPCFKDWTSPSSYKDRPSPLTTVRETLGDTDAPATIQICYGAPSARGRTIFGADDGMIRYGRLWRLGANEPTRLFTDQSVQLGDLRLDAGRYSFYAIPDSSEWRIIVNSSIWHWGNDFSPGVRDSEIGSFVVPSEAVDSFAETLAVSIGDGELQIHWGTTVVRVPVTSTP